MILPLRERPRRRPTEFFNIPLHDILNRRIIVHEPHVLQSSAHPATPPVRAPYSHAPAEVLVALRPLVLRVACQHALDGHAD